MKQARAWVDFCGLLHVDEESDFILEINKTMPTAHKAQVVEMTRERYQRAAGVVFTEYRGLSVPQMQQLRSQLQAKGGEIQVVKNTLFKLAAGDDAESFPPECNTGPTAVVYLYENETEIVKALFDFGKDHKALLVKGGMLDGTVYTNTQIEEISKLPPKEVLLAQVIGTIAAPLSQLVGTVQEILAAPIRAIGAVAEKVEKEGPAPSASTSASAEETTPEQPEEQATSESTEPAEATETAQQDSTPAEETAEQAATDAPTTEEAESTEPAADNTDPQENQ